MKKIYMIGGSKGGVGKSLVAMALLDYLHEQSVPMLLIETDTSNPDVAKAYGATIKTEKVPLDAKDGWLTLIDKIEANKEATIVINSAARNNAAVTDFGAILAGALDELKRELVTLWVINRQRDSLELLREYTAVLGCGRMHVVRNTHYGTAEKFALYNDSKTRAAVEAAGGMTLDFPDLADRVSDELYTKRIRIEDAAATMTIGNRAELQRWRSEYRKMFQGVTK